MTLDIPGGRKAEKSVPSMTLSKEAGIHDPVDTGNERQVVSLVAFDHLLNQL